MYPIVRGSTLKVHGERLVSRPAASTTTYVAGVTPATQQAVQEQALCVGMSAAQSNHQQAAVAPIDQLAGPLRISCLATKHLLDPILVWSGRSEMGTCKLR